MGRDVWHRCDLLWHLSRLRAWCYWPRCTVHCLSQSSGRSLGPGPWSPGAVPVLLQSRWNPGRCRWASRSGTWPHNHLRRSDCGWTPSRTMTPCLTPVVLLGLTEYHILEDTNQQTILSKNYRFRVAVLLFWSGTVLLEGTIWCIEFHLKVRSQS